MPELPEVETVARQLAPDVEGQVLKSLKIHDEKLTGYDWSRVEGLKVRKVSRIGKQVVLEFKKPVGSKKNNPLLSVHLRMTGRLLWKPGGDNKEKPTTHVRAKFEFNKGMMLFQDVRRFGVLKLHENLSEVQPKGEEPLADNFTARDMQKMLKGSKQQIKAWLLRQDRLVGLGNIYCSEILFASGIHPERLATDLEYDEIKLLFKFTRSILRKAIKNCGTTFSDFQDAKGEMGSFQNFLQVYQKEGEPCKKCGDIIKRIKQQQRSTFFCPSCQK